MTIDTVAFSTRLRQRAVSPGEKRVLIARLSDSKQEGDITTPVNCDGYGRIHHFRLEKHDDWSPDPLPNVPAAKALGTTTSPILRVQVFQNAACNWRCWYCYVDYNRLSADLRVSRYFTATELIDLYLAAHDRPPVIDLSGGQPDLVPEWVLWMMEAIEERGLAGKIFLWSDDNLSNDYYWRYLDSQERRYISSFPNYSRVACFKGYDERSFSFNTLAKPELFLQQFRIFHRLLEEGLDMYAYVTFTSPPNNDLQSAMARFVDLQQKIHPQLPLRTIPLKIEMFKPNVSRIHDVHREAMIFQRDVHAAWREQLESRFSNEQLAMNIAEVSLTL